MDEKTIADQIAKVIHLMANYDDYEDAPIPEFVDGVRNVASFEQDGVMTRNAGFSIKMKDGKVFQVTVARSR